MDCGLPGSSILWIFQARILEWVAISFSRGSSRTRDWTGVSHVTGRLPDVWATNATLSIRPTFSYPAWIISFLFLIFCSRYLHMWKIGPRGGECKETWRQQTFAKHLPVRNCPLLLPGTLKPVRKPRLLTVSADFSPRAGHFATLFHCAGWVWNSKQILQLGSSILVALNTLKD